MAERVFESAGSGPRPTARSSIILSGGWAGARAGTGSSNEGGDGPAILYSFRRCPYAMRARMALLVSGTPCEVREVALAAKPAALIAASPKATVPVLVIGAGPEAAGQVIDQSLDIMRWALARHDPEGWLTVPDEAGLIAANDGAFKHHLDRYKYTTRHDGDPLAHRDEGVAMLAGLDARLQAGGHLYGPRRSLADVAIMPFVRQFAQVDRAWFDALPLPALQRWLAAALADPLFGQAMQPRRPWHEGDPPVPL